MKCVARQHSDQMICHQCGLVWDVNDPDRPVCDPPVEDCTKRMAEVTGYFAANPPANDNTEWSDDLI